MGVRRVGLSKWWPWQSVPRSRGWRCLSKEGQIMNRTPAPSWRLLGSAKHWVKTWKLSIDKVQRDVGYSACGPTLKRKGKEKSIKLGSKKAIGHSHIAAKALSSSTPHSQKPQQPCLLTTLSRAPLLKEGWKVISWAWAPGSPWIMPLGEENMQTTGGRCSGRWTWCGKAGESRPNGLPSTYQGSSSNTGLFRVRKRRMTGLPSCTRGFPVRNGSGTRRNSRGRISEQEEKDCSQGMGTTD